MEVVVNFLPQVIFIFPLSIWVTYVNEFETKEKQNLLK